MNCKPLIVVLVICASIFSNKVDAQYSIDIQTYISEDTIAYGQNFDIHVILTNTGSFTITNPINLWYGSHADNSNVINPNSIYQFPITIYPSLLGFAPNDSISVNIQSMQNIPASTVALLQAGDNLIVIWPSSITPINSDSSSNSIHVLNTSTYTNNIFIENIDNGIIYDVYGRQHYSLNTLPIGSMYIRNGKKYVLLYK